MANNPEENIEAQQGDAEAGNSMERIIDTNLPFPQKLDFRGNIAQTGNALNECGLIMK